MNATATSAQETNSDVIAEVKKNASEVIVVRRTEFNGIDLLDCRVWTVPVSPDGESKPTRKGLTLRPETWRELVAVIVAVVGAAELDGGEPSTTGDAVPLAEDV